MTEDDKSTPEIQAEPAKLEDLDKAVADVKKLKKARDEAKEAARLAAVKAAEASKAYQKGLRNRADAIRRLKPSHGVMDLARRAEMEHQQVSRIVNQPDAR